jgi:hypothetical protein
MLVGIGLVNLLMVILFGSVLVPLAIFFALPLAVISRVSRSCWRWTEALTSASHAMTRTRGEPSARAQEALRCYLELGAGRGLARCLDALQRRGQVAGKPSVCRRLATLEAWCSQHGWVEQAAAYDQECARRRALQLQEEERKQAQEDVKLLAQTIRGSIAVAATVLNSYVDGQTGTLLRQDAGLGDVAKLIKVAADSLALVHPGGSLAGPTSSDVEAALRQGSAQQRARMLSAIRELTASVEQIRGS